MNRFSLALTALFLAVFSLSTAFASAPAEGINQKVEWSTNSLWNTDFKPLQLVHSLDGKKVFILGDDQKIHIFSPDGTLLGSVTVGEGVSDIDIAPYGETLYLINAKEKTFSSLSISIIADLEVGSSPVKGPENAPVTIIVFTDFECPYCKKLPPIIDQVLANNPENVRVVLKNMPLTRIHPMAESAARAALAAHLQGKFWQYHDQLFASPRLSQAVLEDIAAKLGLDMKKFKQDMGSMVVRANLAKDMQMAQAAGVNGTPTCFVNGRKVQERSVEGFQKLIDEELKSGD